MNWARDGRAWPLRDASRFVRAGGLDWHVAVAGTGPAILLLHGTGAAAASFRGLVPLLARRFTVVAPDLPGHAFSAVPPRGSMSLPGQARLVGALLDVLAAQTGPITLAVGHSAGAAIAARLVLDRRIVPTALVALNGALTPLPGPSSQLFPAAARLLALTDLAPRLFTLHAGNALWLRRFLDGTGSRLDPDGVALYRALLADRAHVGAALRMMAHWQIAPLAAALPGLPCPLHIVVGDNDRMIRPADGERLAATIPGATLHRLAGLGHLAHEERPDLAAAIVEQEAVRGSARLALAG